MIPTRLPLFTAAVLLGASALPALADVRLPAIFGDHMVLQQSIDLPVWGKADPGEAVMVSLCGQTVHTTAGADGKWSVKLAPLKASAQPVSMTVSGHNTVTFQDVLVGDVWIASGQSNMVFGMSNAHNSIEEVPKASHPTIRLFLVSPRPSFTPEDDVAPGDPKMPLDGHWRVCTPDSVTKEGGWGGFSAVAYFFGKEIQEKTALPLGLIECAAGGKKIQAFTSLEALQKIPEGAPYVKWWEDDRKSAEAQKSSYPERKATYDVAMAQWMKDYGEGLKKAREEWNKQCEQAKIDNLPFPPRPESKVPPPQWPDGTPKVPSISLFNGMIHPIIPYGIKGVIWYQGESNADRPEEYGKLFASMIGDWRERWQQGDFPFLFVQLANYAYRTGWASVRDMQFRSLKIPNTAMAVAIDVGEVNEIHPRDKADVGHRLALAARHLVYRETLPFSGPLYDSMKTEGGAIRIAFTHTDGGLKIGAHPKIYATDVLSVPTELRSFVITGNDRIWHPATAKIEGETVLVSSPEVKDPVAVRYGWENCPDCHLYNGAGLPASPFRTDDWVDGKVNAPTPAH